MGYRCLAELQASLAIAVCVVCFHVFVAVRGMEPHFYDQSCPSAEPTISSMVQNYYNNDASIAPNLIRLLLHDCFVRGCDASILLKSTSGVHVERDVPPNLSLAKSFDLIDQMKDRLEEICPQVVSCADIIAIASRDAVHLAGGQYFELLLGRHDGMVSRASEAMSMLPDLHDSLPRALQAFQAKGFTTEEFLTLLGAHSIGTTQCSFVEGRLFNYEGTGRADPRMRAELVEELKSECGQRSGKRVALDQGTPSKLDNSYYKQVMQGRGVLQVDQQLYLNTSGTNSGEELMEHLVERYARHDFYFQTFFQHSFKKLGLLDVLTHAGEIRTKCYKTNS
ncbi:hypothetical protein GOP47_0014787 [Adiantum capillus-veneris]|uniref:Peroxidase n=1 Tax=Adiantum capillus-veneris TaxID=13818 RepID=A0A9D4UM63_ADICA|nr:hypothetical protein GOP47_0014787 [Adiantum capillus-veneris]